MDKQDIQNAYRKTLMTPLAGVILADLADYCSFLETTTDQFQEGKRDVFLHILEMYGIESMVDVVEALQAVKPTRREEHETSEFYGTD